MVYFLGFKLLFVKLVRFLLDSYFFAHVHLLVFSAVYAHKSEGSRVSETG